MDEDYIRESLLSPQAKARPGFPPSMPSFEGQLKEKEIHGIIAYIKSLQVGTPWRPALLDQERLRHGLPEVR